MDFRKGKKGGWVIIQRHDPYEATFYFFDEESVARKNYEEKLNYMKDPDGRTLLLCSIAEMVGDTSFDDE